MDFLQDHKELEFVSCQEMVFHELYRYYGYIDLKFKDKQGNTWIVEVKTRNTKKQTKLTDKIQLYLQVMAMERQELWNYNTCYSILLELSKDEENYKETNYLNNGLNWEIGFITDELGKINKILTLHGHYEEVYLGKSRNKSK
jgi:hypothetical protein